MDISEGKGSPASALPNTSKQVMVEIDASDYVVGVILLPDGQLVAFESKS